MNSAKRSKHFVILSSMMALLLSASPARADVTVISSPGAFGPGSTILTFTGLADGTEVHGLLFGGVLFTYSLGPGNVVIDGGPGVTNNVNPPNIVSIQNPGGILTLVFPGLQSMFGYGFAILNTAPVANATTITLFSGALSVGSLSYNGVPDPIFAGGFAAIQSTLQFDRAQLTFNSAAAQAFAVDNVRFASVPTVIPEPSVLLLVATGLAAIAIFRRRRRTSDRSPL